MKKVLIKFHYYFSYIITFVLLNSILLNVNKFVFSKLEYSSNVFIELSAVMVVSYVLIKKFYEPSKWR